MTAVAVASHELSFELNGREWFYELDVVEVSACYTDKFQRPLAERWLRKAEQDFRPWLLGTITVSERERRGKVFSVVDGQHRLELVTRKEISVIAAVILTGLTIEDEAALFSDLQSERRGITPFQRFQADIVAKRPDQLAINAMLADGAIKLELTETSDGPGLIKCVRMLERIYDDDPAVLRKVLTLVQRTWPGMPLARSERFVSGLYRFCKDEDKTASRGQDVPTTGGASVDLERFVDRLASRTPSTLNVKAQQLREGGEGGGTLPQYLATVISNAYRSSAKRR
jgi:hypothetical protein